MCYRDKKFKTGIKSWMSFEKLQQIIKFNQHALLKPYIDMITDLRKKPKIIFKNTFLH